MRVGLLVCRAAVIGRTTFGIVCIHRNCVVIHVSTLRVMQVAIVKIIGVAIVFHGGVPAVWAMLVAVGPRVLLVSLSHCSSLPQRDSVPRPRVH